MEKGGKPCVEFLQWALPHIHLRWEGYKHVREQVCGRIGKRFKELHLNNYSDYKAFLLSHEEEWITLDQCTHITISKFFRDLGAWQALEEKLLPELAKRAHESKRAFRCWSAGCASGEEPYSFAILWKQKIAPLFPDLSLEIIATEVDDVMLGRAQKACYTRGSLKNVRVDWLEEAFQNQDSFYCLKNSYQSMVGLHKQDIREEMPGGLFDIIFCKNIVGMYFSNELAIKTFQKIGAKMYSGSLLILGNHEPSPLEEVTEIELLDKGRTIYRKK